MTTSYVPKGIRVVAMLAALAGIGVFPLQAQQAGTGPVKIFILAGQSNMVGMGEVSPATTPGTLEYIIANDPDYAFLGNGVGGIGVRDDVWIQYETIGGDLTAGYGGSTTRVGPELGFGHAVGDLYEQQVLLIKYARGGRSLGNDFLPPSSGPYPTPVADGDTGYHYKGILDLVTAVTSDLTSYFPDYDGGGYEIAGFCWHQGWNDRIDTNFSAAYETNMANFINDIRGDLGIPNLPFVIMTTSMDPPPAYTQVELAQLAMANPTAHPSFAGNVAVIDGRQAYEGMDFWLLASESPVNEGYHWNRNAKSYTNIGLAMADAMSLMVPPRTPYRLRASASGSTITLDWENGTELPTDIQILRNGSPLSTTGQSPPPFLDPTGDNGIQNYTVNFTMAGDPAPSLSVTYDGSISDLEAYRLQQNVKLKWQNNFDYAGIEVRRDNVLIDTLAGTATSYTDTAPPASGDVTYSVKPTDGTAAATETVINLDGLSPGNCYVYEGFEDGDASLDENVAGPGLVGLWDGGLNVAAGSMSWGALPTSGNQVFNAGGNTTCGATVRADLAEAGLLDHGAELWFSFLTNNTSGTNTAVQFCFGTSRAGFFDGVQDGGEGIGVNLVQGSSPRACSWAPGRTQAGSASGSIATDTTAMVVGRILWGADGAASDTIEIYLPGTDLLLPGAPVSTHTAVLDQSVFDTISMAGKNAGSPKVDEIRMGASFNDVVAYDIIQNDSVAPAPDPMTWASPPAAVNDSSITMTATTATDTNGVEYFFDETSGNPGGTDSGWQDSPVYVDEGLNPSMTYSYRVKARDKSPNQNETAVSSPVAQATTDALDSTPPPVPGFDVLPNATSPTVVTMTASAVVDPSGVEYYFTETSGNPGGDDSGWQDSLEYTDDGLDPETTYSYTVKARDKSSAQNESAPSTSQGVTTPAQPGGSGPVIYEPFDDADPSLNGNAVGLGLTGTWSGGYSVDAGSYSYGTLPTSGNRAVANSRTGSSASTGTTLSDAGLMADGVTLWFSVVHLTQSASNGNMDFGFALGSTGLAGSNNVPMSGQGMGFSFKNGQIRASFWDSPDADGTEVERSGGASASYGAPVLVVGEIIWGSGGAADVINIYLPDTDLNQGAVVSSISEVLDQSQFNVISFSNKGDLLPVGVDEIRFGGSYADVIGANDGGGGDYDTWAGGYGGLDLSDPLGDADGDGWSNDEERIWGTNPGNGAHGGPVTVQLDPGAGTFSYSRRDDALTGLTYTVWTSADLQNWIEDLTAVQLDGTPDGGGVETVDVTVTAALLSASELYVQVRAE